MGDQPVVLAVASYASRAAANADFDGLWSLQSVKGGNHLTAALVEKGASGELEMTCHRQGAAGLAWDVALLGGALTTVAAPVGISHLAWGLSSNAEWAGAAAIVGRFWHHIPRDTLRSMSNLLEAGQTGLVVVAVGHRTRDVVARLSGATSRVLGGPMQVDLVADFANALGGA
jgi:hypothetical protein